QLECLAVVLAGEQAAFRGCYEHFLSFHGNDAGDSSVECRLRFPGVAAVARVPQRALEDLVDLLVIDSRLETFGHVAKEGFLCNETLAALLPCLAVVLRYGEPQPA